jgi:hypothetical protein
MSVQEFSCVIMRIVRELAFMYASVHLLLLSLLHVRT